MRNTLTSISAEHNGHLELISYIVNSMFEEYRATLQVIANSNECTAYLENPSEQTQEELTRNFFRMANNRNYVKGIVFSTVLADPLFGITHFSDELLPFSNDLRYKTNWERISPLTQNLKAGDINFSPFSYTTLMEKEECLSLIGLQIPIYHRGGVYPYSWDASRWALNS